jgi:hypothetical protein
MSPLSERIAAARPYWDAYWSGAAPMLCAALPGDPARPVRKPPLGMTSKTDLDALAADLLRWEESTVFLGGALPFYCVYFFDIYNLLGAFLGGQVEACGDSHRMVPFVADLDTAELVFNPRAEVADRLKRVVAQLRERCGDRVLISASAVGSNLDALEAVRGSTQLLLDLEDNAPGVHRCLAQIDAAAAQLLDFHAESYDFNTYGSVCRHGMYTAGRVGVPQCDFGYMIGPERFRDFAFPYLQREFARLDGVCYHLDGIGNLPNLELLCGEPRLHLIQWVPGTGHERDDWSWLREKIDSLGKGQMLRGTVGDFERWYATHTAPWQYWTLGGSTADEIAACVRNLRGTSTRGRIAGQRLN